MMIENLRDLIRDRGISAQNGASDLGAFGATQSTFLLGQPYAAEFAIGHPSHQEISGSGSASSAVDIAAAHPYVGSALQDFTAIASPALTSVYQAGASPTGVIASATSATAAPPFFAAIGDGSHISPVDPQKHEPSSPAPASPAPHGSSSPTSLATPATDLMESVPALDPLSALPLHVGGADLSQSLQLAQGAAALGQTLATINGLIHTNSILMATNLGLVASAAIDTLLPPQLPELATAAVEPIASLLPAAATGLSDLVGDVATSALPAAGEIVAPVDDVLPSAIAAVAALPAAVEPIAPMATAILTPVTETVTDIAVPVIESLPSAAQTIAPVAETVAQVASALPDDIETITAPVAPLVGSVGETATALSANAVPVVAATVEIVTDLLPDLGAQQPAGEELIAPALSSTVASATQTLAGQDVSAGVQTLAGLLASEASFVVQDAVTGSEIFSPSLAPPDLLSDTVALVTSEAAHGLDGDLLSHDDTPFHALGTGLGDLLHGDGGLHG